MKNLLLGSVFSALLFSSAMAVPFVGFVAGFLAASPLVFVRFSTGSRNISVLSVALAALIVGIAFKPPSAIWYIAQCGMAGLIVPELLLKGKSNSSILLWATAISTLASAAVAVMFSMMAGQEIGALASKEIMTGIDQLVSLYEQQQSLSRDELEIVRHGLKKAGNLMVQIYPALATINMFFFSAATLVVSRWLAVKYSLQELQQTRFSDFRTPDVLIWPLIVAGFTMFTPVALLKTPALNIIALLLPLYFLQGLAVAVTLSDRSQFKGLLKVMLGVLLIAQPYLIVVLTILGMFDLWGEFRIPRQKREENL